MIWILFLSVLGIGFWCIEIFMPGIVFGALGSLCLVGGVIISYALYGVSVGNLILLAMLLIVTASILLEITILPKTRYARMIVTKADLVESKSADSLEALLGRIGKSLTPLRPSGAAQFDRERVDVMAETGLIESGCSVKVVRVEGNRVVVRKLES